MIATTRPELGSKLQAGLVERSGAFWAQVVEVWRTEVIPGGDDPITVGKLILALFLILLGYSISRFVSKVMARRLFPRLGLDAGATATFQTLSFYVLLILVFLYALRLVNIPLTVFTVLGGAVAIGVGFGSQNIVNNFISGLILMAERPIKVGDVIEVEGVYGTVERIGPRSTRVRKGDNTHIIVPNSSFLEKNVLNWTLSDDVMRVEVLVGVAYGSPAERVRDVLLEAMSQIERVIKKPSPEVLFLDFGDNALVFQALFWIKLRRPLDQRRVASTLRYTIDRLFRENDIVIAFPQRDVHLDTVRPLEVRLLDGAKHRPTGDDAGADD